MMNSEKKRILEFEGIQNLRDIGGYTSRSGQKIRYNRLLRSGNLDQVPAKSQTRLLTYGVNYIIDVRDQWEQAKYPNVFTNIVEVRYQNIPFIGDSHLKDNESQGKMGEADSLSDTYAFLLDNCKEQVVNIIQAIAQSSKVDCTIVHCVAGKDRTGLIIALLLAALDIPSKTIVQDYALSGIWSNELENQWQVEDDDPQEMMKRKRDAAATKEIMKRTLLYLQENYGGINDYLDAIGCDNSLREKLQNQLLDSGHKM
jgi:protein-tyrosine phosphatase